MRRKGENRKILGMLSYREETDEPEGVKELGVYEGKKFPLVLVRRVEGRKVKDTDGIKVLEAAFPAEAFALLPKDVAEGRVSLLAVLAKRFPHTIKEGLERARSLVPAVETELNEIFTNTVKKMERGQVEQKMSEVRQTFPDSLPDAVKDRYAPQLIF